jgi:uncharacterized protein YhaN
MRDDEKLQQMNQEIRILEEDVKELQRKHDLINMQDLKVNAEKAQQEVKKPSLALTLAIIFCSIISLPLIFLLAIPRAFAAISVGIVITVLTWFIVKQKSITKIQSDNLDLLKKASVVFPGITSVFGIIDNIEKSEKMKTEKEILLKEKKNIKAHLSSKDSLEKIEQALSQLRNKTGLADLDDLDRKLKEKYTLEKERNTLHGKILGILSEADEKKWPRLIERMKSKAPEIEPDVSCEDVLRKEIEELKGRVERLRHDIEVFKEVQQKQFNIPNTRLAFLEYARLSKQLEEYELEKQAALATREILRSMSSELDDCIENILTGNNSIGEYFSTITDRYKEVEVKNNNLIVKDRHKKTYTVDELSSGTQDQLLLCFRMAALQKIYPEGTFLVLDDAFIFADWKRRTKLTELLKKFVENGNQVIYLTSDDHTRDLLEKSGATITTI